MTDVTKNVEVCISGKTQYNSNSVNFCGYRTKLGRKLDEVLKLGEISPSDNEFLLCELKKLLEKRINQTKNLGEGMSNRVYKIDDKYVIKIPLNKSIMLDNSIVIKPQKYGDLKAYYGEPVFEAGNIQILRNASSKGQAIPAGVPKSLPDGYEKSDIQGYYSDFYLPTFANLPQRSYDALASDMKTLSERCENSIHFTFDYYNPNNVVLSGKSLRMTDEVEMTVFEKTNTISDMLNVFLKQINVGIPAAPSTKLLPLRQEIAQKILKAGMKNDLEITSEGRPNNVFSYVIKFLCGSKEEPARVFERLEEIKHSAKTQKEAETMLDEYLEMIFG